jgi:uncharacterized protein GlcG (DUF336 family)
VLGGVAHATDEPLAGALGVSFGALDDDKTVSAPGPADLEG